MPFLASAMLRQGSFGWADFEGVVLPAAGELRMGLLQADFNDANIIIRRCG